MFVRRVATSNSRITQGEIYKVHFHNSGGKRYIIDDNGDQMRPSSNRKYWIEETRERYAERAVKETPNFIDFDEETKQTENKETVMKHVKIENVVLVNGVRADEMSEDQIIELISNEEVKVANLVEVKTKLSLIDKIKGESKAINKIMNRHVDNIIALVAILDLRDTQEK